MARGKVSFSILPSSVSLRMGCERACPALGPAAWPAEFGSSAVTGYRAPGPSLRRGVLFGGAWRGAAQTHLTSEPVFAPGPFSAPVLPLALPTPKS